MPKIDTKDAEKRLSYGPVCDYQNDIVRDLERSFNKLTKPEAYKLYGVSLFRRHTKVCSQLETHGYTIKKHFTLKTRRTVKPEQSYVKEAFLLLETNKEEAFKAFTSLLETHQASIEDIESAIFSAIKDRDYENALFFSKIAPTIGLELGLELMLYCIKLNKFNTFQTLLQKMRADVFNKDSAKYLYPSNEKLEAVDYKRVYWIKMINCALEKTVEGLTKSLTLIEQANLINLLELGPNTTMHVVLNLSLKSFEYAISHGIKFDKINYKIIDELLKDKNGMIKLNPILAERTFYTHDMSWPRGISFNSVYYEYDSFYDYAAVTAAECGNLEYFKSNLRRVREYRSITYNTNGNIQSLCHNIALQHSHTELIKFFKENNVDYDKSAYPDRVVTFILSKKPILTENSTDKPNGLEADLDTVSSGGTKHKYL